MNKRHDGWTGLAIGAGLLGCAALVAFRKKAVSFRGKTVVITGGSCGLGLELARRWAAEGARVVICARTGADISRAVNELRTRGYDAHGFECDVTDARQVEDFIARVIDRFGAVDILVNNAGIIQVGPQPCLTRQDYQDAL